MGPEDGREDPPDPGAGPEPAGADGLPRRLGRGADHRPGPDVPGAARRRADLPQRGPPLRPGPPGLPPVRAERRRRRLHPGLLRRRDHARRQRLDVPRLAADGGDGDRRDGDARGDGRGEDAHRRSPAAATSSSPTTRRRSTSPSATSRSCRRTGASARGRSPPPRPPRRPRSPRSSRPTRTRPST